VRSGALPLLASSISESGLDTSMAQRRIARILGAGVPPLPRVSRRWPRNIKARLPETAPQRSKGALMQTSFACGQGFAPTPHSPAPTGDHPTERGPRRSRGRSGDQHGRLRSGGRTGGPPCEGPARLARGTETAARSAPRTPAATLAPPSRPASLRGQIWGLCGPISLSPRAPLSRPVPERPALPMANIPPSGRLRPRGRGKPLPCLCAVLWDRELSL